MRKCEDRKRNLSRGNECCAVNRGTESEDKRLPTSGMGLGALAGSDKVRKGDLLVRI